MDNGEESLKITEDLSMQFFSFDWWKSRYGSHKRGLNSKIHLAVNEKGLPLAVSITSGTVADCTEAVSLIENLKAEGLIADRAYDTDEIITFSVEHYKIVVIPPKRNRKLQRDYDKEIYKMRHFVENVILDLKHWRGIATRYDKLTESFLAAVFCRCIAI